MTSHGIPLPHLGGEEEDPRPVAYRILFDEVEDLTKITETPNHMIIPMVRLTVLQAACNPTRKMSLIEVFQRAFDARMISRERQGRIEAVELMRAMNSSGMGEDETPL